MKKFCAAFIIFTVSVVFTAVWYSPLLSVGEVVVYDNNKPINTVNGVCYSADAVARVDINGGENEMYAALEKLGAQVVCTAQAGDRVIVYAYSPRVAHDCLTATNGGEYNIMAAYGGGKVVIGTPVLQGSY